MPSQTLVRLQFDVMMVPPPESVNFKDFGHTSRNLLNVSTMSPVFVVK